ncbi:hypothetical protein Bhyg_09913 [Pseudolycoriella hygida]|uniref:XK-related protein n=1 Tax=Pseudolycoriella hygida TaxID=35572 RepID=A0A9Q0RWW4_9DIPT|nr:hypothetical protein Bhyg_09913 [Pseudolycoriella hygida]
MCGKENIMFFLKQLFNLFLFPIGSTYRFSRRIFWSVEAIFHDRDTYERHHAVHKAAETSPFELYHFLQAYLHAAPQIVLQFFILLRGDVFRNYETSHVQVISIIFSLLTMAMVASSYQRFESQKVVGRNYPWSSEVQCSTRRKQFRRTTTILEERKPVEPTYVEIPGSEQIMTRFNSTIAGDEDENEFNTTIRHHDHKSLHLGNFNLNEENNFTFADQHKNIHFDEIDGDTHKSLDSSKILNIPLDENRPRRPSMLDLNAIVQYENESNNDIDDNNQGNLDFSPDHPAPPPPDVKHFILNQFNRFSTFKDMLVTNAELYIKEHVPRLPDKLFENEKAHLSTNDAKEDEVDFMMPSRKKIVEGIEQEDIVAKSVAFTAWTFFLVMRMVSLSAFSVFFPLE